MGRKDIKTIDFYDVKWVPSCAKDRALGSSLDRQLTSYRH